MILKLLVRRLKHIVSNQYITWHVGRMIWSFIDMSYVSEFLIGSLMWQTTLLDMDANKILTPSKILQRFARVFVGFAVFAFAVTISPLFLLFYLLCRLRFAITRLVIHDRSMTPLVSQDAISGQDMATCNAIISVLTVLDGDVKREQLRDVMLQRVVLAKNDHERLLFPKFSRYVSMVGDYLAWKDESNFNVDNHVLYYGEKPPQTDEQLKQIVQNICNTPMDADKSGWQVIIVPLEGDVLWNVSKLEAKSSCTCVVWRFHHSIADGISLTRLVMEQIAENNDEFREAVRQMLKRSNYVPNFWLYRLAFHAFRNMCALFSAPFVMTNQLLTREKNVLHGPQLSGQKLVEWGKPVSLQTVKDIKNATSTTVNDVVVSCLGGGLRRYFIRRKVDVPKAVSTVIPVTMQTADEPLSTSNNFSFVVTEVVTAGSDALQRLRVTKSIMDSTKRSPSVLINSWFIRHMFNVLPNSMSKFIIDMSPVTLIASNVPGPTKPVTICGHKVIQVIPFLPHRGHTGLAVCVFSYVGEIRIGISVDSVLMKRKEDVQLLIQGFNEELCELAQVLRI